MNTQNKQELRDSQKAKLGWGEMKKIAKAAQVDRSVVDDYFRCNNDNYAVQFAVEKFIKQKEEGITKRLQSQS